VARVPPKTGRFSVFVCAPRPVAAIPGYRHVVGMDNLRNSIISAGGLGYSGRVRGPQNGNSGQKEVRVYNGRGTAPWRLRIAKRLKYHCGRWFL
jgi:hypothetical protein